MTSPPITNLERYLISARFYDELKMCLVLRLTGGVTVYIDSMDYHCSSPPSRESIRCNAHSRLATEYKKQSPNPYPGLYIEAPPLLGEEKMREMLSTTQIEEAYQKATDKFLLKLAHAKLKLGEYICEET